MFEELEQIPWTELVSKRKRAGPWAIALLAGVLALVTVLLWISSTPAVESTAAVEPTPVDVASQVSAVLVDEETDQMLSEADLQTATGSSELVALGAAVVEVRAMSSPVHYIEWAVAEGITPLGSDRWAVRVAFQALIPGADGPERSPIRRVDVPVGVVDGRWQRIGPVSLSTYEPAPMTDVWELEPVPVTTELAEAVSRLLATWGAVEIEDAGALGSLTRVTVDTGGMTLVVWWDGTDAVQAVPVPPVAGS